MRVRAVASYSSPAYPDRTAFLSNANRLDRHLPAAWKAHGLTAGAIAAFFLSNCGSNDDAVGPQSGPLVYTSPLSPSKEQTVRQNEKQVAIAPLFLHGSDRGALGCVMIAPPVFISEEDARDIIFTMFQEAGVSFEKRDSVFSDIQIDQRISMSEDRDSVTGQKPLVLDAYSSGYNLGLEYVSINDYHDLGGSANHFVSVQSYDIPEVADSLRSRLRAYDKINAGVLYEPFEMADYSNWFTMTQEEQQASIDAAHERAVVNLRAQVADLIAWLQAEEVIPHTGVRRLP